MKERLCGGEGDRGPVPFPSIHVKKNAKEKKYPTACNSGTLHTHTHTHTLEQRHTSGCAPHTTFAHVCFQFVFSDGLEVIHIFLRNTRILRNLTSIIFLFLS